MNTDNVNSPTVDLSHEAGFSLAELIVSIAILGIVLGALASGAIAIQRVTYSVDVRTENVGSARVAMENLSRRIRSAAEPVTGAAEDEDAVNAPAFEVADPERAVFFANVDATEVPALVEFRITPERTLVEEVTTPTIDGDGDVTYLTENRRSRLLVDDVAAGSLFTYVRRNDTGAEIELGDEPSLDDRRNISRVGIDLRISRNEDRVAGQPLTTTVRIPNRT